MTIIGLGEDGPEGLPSASRVALARAEVIFGGPRHLDLVAAGARGEAWPVPFDASRVLAHRGKRVVVLASGDPFWFGAGGSLMALVHPGEWVSHPAPRALRWRRTGWVGGWRSAFVWACMPRPYPAAPGSGAGRAGDLHPA